MNAPRHPFQFILSLALAAGWLGETDSLAAESTPLPIRKYTPVERLALPRLKAAHEDAERFSKMRQSLAPIAGLHDFPAILHAHAEDSAHTGGTRPEMLADAKRAGVAVILLTDHYRPPRDFIQDTWRGLRDGVLFIPGSEVRGFLVHPTHSILDKMDAAQPDFIKIVTAGDGLIFLSHIEERPDHPMEGLTGLEIYNRHADAKKDVATLLALAMKATDPKQLAELEEGLRLYPDELLAAQVDYPKEYLDKWDAETRTRRLTGIAANDCHHNQIIIVKMVDEETVRIGTNVEADEKMRTLTAASRPGIREMTKNRKPGDVLARLDFDSYYRSFRNVSTHILAPELSEASIRAALKAGHAYVSHDWMCDPTGFSFEAVPRDGTLDPAISQATNGATPPAGLPARTLMGDEVNFKTGLTLVVKTPVPCKIRLFKNGKLLSEANQSLWARAVEGAGVYRVEAFLTMDGEERAWILANPIYAR